MTTNKAKSRCTQELPILRQSSQPFALGSTSPELVEDAYILTLYYFTEVSLISMHFLKLDLSIAAALIVYCI